MADSPTLKKIAQIIVDAFDVDMQIGAGDLIDKLMASLQGQQFAAWARANPTQFAVLIRGFSIVAKQVGRDKGLLASTIFDQLSRIPAQLHKTIFDTPSGQSGATNFTASLIKTVAEELARGWAFRAAYELLLDECILTTMGPQIPDALQRQVNELIISKAPTSAKLEFFQKHLSQFDNLLILAFESHEVKKRELRELFGESKEIDFLKEADYMLMKAIILKTETHFTGEFTRLRHSDGSNLAAMRFLRRTEQNFGAGVIRGMKMYEHFYKASPLATSMP